MVKSKLFIFLLCIQQTPLALTSPKDSNSIGTYEIPGLTFVKQNGHYSGEFYKLGQKILKKSNPGIRLNVLPAKRVLNDFKNGNIIGFYPALDQLVEQVPFKVCKTREFAFKKDFIFYRNDKKAKTINDLKNSIVGITRGYSISEAILKNKNFKISVAQSDSANLQMLSKGRIDFYIAEENTALYQIKILRLNNISYDSSSPVFRQSAYFAFSNTEKGKSLCREVDKSLASLNESGEWNFEKVIQQITAGLK
jgi:ABC-type amino acid transport substrate-binding protein